MNSLMEAVQTFLQPFLVLPPPNPINSGGCLSLQGKEAFSELRDGDMVE
jgi:hypothetical protein